MECRTAPYDTPSRQRLDSGGWGSGERTGKLWLSQYVVDSPAIGVCVESVSSSAAAIDAFIIIIISLLSFVFETTSEIKRCYMSDCLRFLRCWKKEIVWMSPCLCKVIYTHILMYIYVYPTLQCVAIAREEKSLLWSFYHTVWPNGYFGKQNKYSTIEDYNYLHNRNERLWRIDL